MKFSVITVCYNAAGTLERTIRSVLGQAGTADLEYILIDGGSTDGTLDIINRYADRIAFWSSEPDEGIFDAMNKGIRVTTGEWVGIINGDDWYGRHTFSRVMDCIRAEDRPDVVVGQVMRVAEDLSYGKIVEPPAGVFAVDRPNNHPASFARRRVYEIEGGYDDRFRLAADVEWILRVQSAERWSIKTCGNVLSYMLEGGASRGFEGIKEGCRIAAKYHGNVHAMKTFARKLFQKTRRIGLDGALPSGLSSRLRERWWGNHHAVRRLTEEDLWMDEVEV